MLKKCFPSNNTANQSGRPAGSGGGSVPESSGGDVSHQKPTNADDKRVDKHSVGSADPSESSSGELPYLANNDLGIAGSQSLIKSFIALVQLFSIIQILRADKVHDYGAYQLTLIPYALMSFVNIVSGFLAPSYPAVYMVESTVMKEARKRGGVFDGVVGLLDEDEEEQIMRKMIADGRELDLPTEPKTAQKGGRWKRPRQKRPYSLISYGDFYAADNEVFRMGGYFHHLARSFPILRLLKDPFLLERLGRNNFYSLITKPANDTKEPAKNTNGKKKKREDKTMSSQRIFQALFKTKAPKDNPKTYLAVLEIGNAKHTPAVNSFMAFLMDVVILTALAIPYVTIYALTGFNAPSSPERVHGIVFMLWLTVGEVLPFLLIPSWNLINLQFWRVKLNRRILEGFLSTSVFTGAALAGFYFVGEMRYQDLVQQNTNCSKSKNFNAL